jgi:WD40 repeat protein
VHRFAEHTAAVRALHLSPVASDIAPGSFYSIGSDDAVCLLSAHTLKWSVYRRLVRLRPVLTAARSTAILSGHSGPVRDVLWHGSHEFVVVSCGDGSAYVWLVRTHRVAVRCRQRADTGWDGGRRQVECWMLGWWGRMRPSWWTPCARRVSDMTSPACECLTSCRSAQSERRATMGPAVETLSVHVGSGTSAHGCSNQCLCQGVTQARRR